MDDFKSFPKILPRFERREEDLYVDTAYRILYEDTFLIAVDKPAPLPVHAVGRFKEKNLLSLMKMAGCGETLSIVNRLDSETSGIVLAAKSSEVAGKLGIQFQERQVSKEYLGIVMGCLKVKQGRITFPLATSTQGLQHIRVPDPAGQTAETDYEVIEEKESYSWIKIRPLTGRTHQIRAHLKAIGHPLVGDKIYIDCGIFEQYIRHGWLESMRPTVLLPRLALHASSLRITHPVNQKPLEFISECPKVLQDFWNSL